jgi:hypothetical protein
MRSGVLLYWSLFFSVAAEEARQLQRNRSGLPGSFGKRGRPCVRSEKSLSVRPAVPGRRWVRRANHRTGQVHPHEGNAIATQSSSPRIRTT